MVCIVTSVAQVLKMAPKRLTALSLKDKIQIIESVQNKKNKKELAAKYKCDVSTINRIVKKGNEIRSNAANNVNMKRKRLRKSSHEKVEKALTLWFDENRQKSGIITSHMLLEKAKEFALVLDKDFKPDLSWIWRWRQREGIKFKKIHGELSSNDTEGASNYQNLVLPQLLSGYSADNVFNADETGLFYRALPNATQARATEQPTGHKLQKSRLTLLFLCNATGSFKRIYAIGKSKNPRCFANKHLPMKYYSNQKAWMTSKIWNEILKSFDDDLVAKGRKIILFVDNAACHKMHLQLKNIKLQFLPPNATAIVQPLDQGIIHAFKMHYRKIIVRRQLFALERGKSVKEFCQSISILNAMQFAYNAWESVSTNSIANCFKKAGFLFNDEEFESDNEDLEIVPDANEYVHCDDHVPCFGSLEEDEILEALMKELTAEVDEENILPEAVPTKLKDALLALEVLQNFCEENEIFFNTNNLENKICKLLVNKLGQSKINDFFKIPC